MNSDTKKRQYPAVTLAYARIIFDGFLEKHPSAGSCIGLKAPIILNGQFESALIKIQQCSEKDFSHLERKPVIHLLQPSTDTPHQERSENDLSFADRFLERHKSVGDS